MTNTIRVRGNMGSRSFRIGTITATATQTTEDVDTGMGTVEFMTVTLANTTLAETVSPVINESLPVAGSAVTVLVPSSGATRTYEYFAIGYP